MQQSHAIGLIVSDITNPFFAEVIVAIEERLASAHLVSLLGNTSEDNAKEERLIQTMREFPADGILICPAIGRKAPAGRLNLPSHLPAVAFARRAVGLDYAGVDNVQGSDLAVEHLCTLGNRRIAFIGGDPDVSTGRERMEGYQRSLVRFGLPLDAGLVVPTPPTRRGGYESLPRLMQIKNRPTAALCFNDVVAFGLIGRSSTCRSASG